MANQINKWVHSIFYNVFSDFHHETQSAKASSCQRSGQCWTPATSPASACGYDNNYVSGNYHENDTTSQSVTSLGISSKSTCLKCRVTPSADNPLTSPNGTLLTSSHGNLVTSSEGLLVTSSSGIIMTSSGTLCPFCESRYPGDDCRDGFCSSVWDSGKSFRSIHL